MSRPDAYLQAPGFLFIIYLLSFWERVWHFWAYGFRRLRLSRPWTIDAALADTKGIKKPQTAGDSQEAGHGRIERGKKALKDRQARIVISTPGDLA